MFIKTKRVFDGEAPDTKTEKHSKKFIAAILVPIMFGWLLHVLTGDGPWGLKHCVFTLTMVPMTLVSIKGFSDLQVGQVLNRSSSWDRKTMNFGSV
jgi:F0F1-type ATP synthase assembly protein I